MHDGPDDGGGLSPDEAFGLLSNETRMTILRTLWNADEPLPFSRLLERAGVDDSGNFNYHLDQLVGHFVARVDGGYVLREAGKSVIRTVLSGVFTADAYHEPVVVDERCPYCGSPVEFSYRDERITVRCTDCDGVVNGDEFPPGTYMSFPFPPAGLVERTPEEVIAAAHSLYDGKIIPMMGGVCPECSGRTSVDVDVCADHEVTDGGLCPECDSRYKVWSEYYCTHCGYSRRSALWFKLMNHAAVVSFFHEHGDLDAFVPLRKLTWENARYITNISETVVSEEPLEVRVDIPFEGKTLHVTVDAALEVVEIEQ